MTQVRQRAVFGLIIWTFVAFGFVISFVVGGGPATYADDAMRIFVGALFIALGLVGFPIILWLTRVRAGARPIVADERDELIALRASRGALVVVLAGVYIFCIVLWIVYRKGGQLPIGWMWFLGYGTAIVGYLAQFIAELLLDTEISGNAES